MILFEFSNPPYVSFVDANGVTQYRSIGEEVIAAPGTIVSVYADIKCTGVIGAVVPGHEAARLVAAWDGGVQGWSGWDYYYLNEIKTNRTCTVTIPTTEKEVSFYVESEAGAHDTKCCVTLKPTVAGEASWKSVSEPYWVDDTVKIDYEGQNLVAGETYKGWIAWAGQRRSQGTSINSENPIGDVSTPSSFIDFYGSDITVELWNGEKYDSISKTIPEKVVPECAELTCIDTTHTPGEDFIFSAILSACFAPELKIGGKKITFVFTIDESTATIDAFTDGYSGLATAIFPGAMTTLIPPGTYSFTAGFVGDADWGADTCTGTLTVISEKKDTSLTSCSATYSSGIVHFYATLKDEDGIGLFNKPVKFFIDNVHVDTGYSDTDGSVSEPYVCTLSPGTYAIKAEFVGDGSYNPSSCTATLTIEELTCEYTGYACDGKIADDAVPSSAVEGSEVEGSVTIDNLCLPGVDPEPTRYRVKFTLNGTVTYLGECVLKNNRLTPGEYPYEMLVPFTFLMPANDITLIAEVEHCNASGEWESCEHTDHIKTYTIALTLYEGPYGVIVESYPKLIKNSSEYICTDTCEDDNPCFLDEGDDISFKVKIKNAGSATGKFQVFVVNEETEEVIGYAPFGKRVELDLGEVSDELDIFMLVGKGNMIDHNYPLRFEARRYDEHMEPTIIDGTKSVMVCYKQVVNGYSIVLNDLPDEIHTGDKITFSGTLSHDAGGAVDNKTIEIMEKDIDPDDFIAKGTTNPDGTFAISWTVKKVGGWLEGKTAEFYARFKFDSKEVISNVERVAIVGPSITKAIVYGGVAVAVFAGGSIAESFAGPKGKMIGTPVKLGALIPAGLCGYQTYLIAKDKIPEWMKD